MNAAVLSGEIGETGRSLTDGLGRLVMARRPSRHSAGLSDLVVVLPGERTSGPSSIANAPGELHGPFVLHSIPNWQVLKPIPVVVAKEDEGFVASIPKAEVHASGETHSEAIANAALMAVDLFDLLSEREDVLGPRPRRQLSVLRSYMLPADHDERRREQDRG